MHRESRTVHAQKFLDDPPSIFVFSYSLDPTRTKLAWRFAVADSSSPRAEPREKILLQLVRGSHCSVKRTRPESLVDVPFVREEPFPTIKTSQRKTYSLDISCTLSSAERWSRRTSDNERIGVGWSNENGCECRSERKKSFSPQISSVESLWKKIPRLFH